MKHVSESVRRRGCSRARLEQHGRSLMIFVRVVGSGEGLAREKGEGDSHSATRGCIKLVYPYRLHRSSLSLSRQQVKKLLAGSTTTMLSELGPSPEKQPVEGLKGPNTGPALKLIFLDVDGVICCNGRWPARE